MVTCNICIKLALNTMDIHQNNLIKIQQSMFSAHKSLQKAPRSPTSTFKAHKSLTIIFSINKSAKNIL
jgi:hypothetical protein